MRSPNMRRLVGLLLGVAAFVAACGTPGAQDAGDGSTDETQADESNQGGADSLRVALPTKGLLFLPFNVAREEGFFEDHAVEVEMTQAGGKNAVTAVASGDADAVIIVPEIVLSAQAGGAPLQIVGATVDENVFGFYVSEDMGSLENLAGEKVGIMGGSGGIEYMTRWLLDEHGPGADESEIVQSGVPPEALAAFKEGEIAGRVFPPYFGQLTEQAGGKRLVDYAKYEKGYPQVVAASEGLLENRPEAVRSFMDAIVDGADFIRDNPDKAVDIAVDATGGERGPMAEALEQTQEHYTDDGAVPVDGLEWVLSLMERYGDVESLPSVEGAYDPSFVEGG